MENIIPVYIDETTYLKIISRAAKNNGRVIFESQCNSPFEIEMDAEHAKKEWDEILDHICKTFDMDYQEAASIMNHYITDF